jgi:hypothetical protein
MRSVVWIVVLIDGGAHSAFHRGSKAAAISQKRAIWRIVVRCS